MPKKIIKPIEVARTLIGFRPLHEAIAAIYRVVYSDGTQATILGRTVYGRNRSFYSVQETGLTRRVYRPDLWPTFKMAEALFEILNSACSWADSYEEPKKTTKKKTVKKYSRKKASRIIEL